jgi:hypothetical protein
MAAPRTRNGTPVPRNRSETTAMNDSPATAPARVPITVMPIWMAAKYRSGSACRRWTVFARRSPASARDFMRLFRHETSAISDPEKNALRRIRTAMSARIKSRS